MRNVVSPPTITTSSKSFLINHFATSQTHDSQLSKNDGTVMRFNLPVPSG